MSHQDFEAQIDAQLDGELDDAGARELEAHLRGCADCVRFRDERLALRAAIRDRVPAFHAPEALRLRVRTALETPVLLPTPRRFSLRSLSLPVALAASLVLVALGSWNLSRRHAAGEMLADEVLASHIRSLMPGHLMDVVSSDQHTVKPWFNGKLDYSPPVHDFAGYPLLGGRLDYVNGRSVAALAYGRRQHVINVFVWPATRGPGEAPVIRDRQGYHELYWTTPDYIYWVVSDLSLSELRDFAGLVQQADSGARRSKRTHGRPRTDVILSPWSSSRRAPILGSTLSSRRSWSAFSPNSFCSLAVARVVMPARTATTI